MLKHCYNGNGHVHVAVDLACTQVGAGHDVAFASSGGSYESLLTEHGVSVTTLPAPDGLRGTTSSIRALVDLVRRYRPDVLHAHMMTSAVMGFIASKTMRVPMVTTVHNSFDRHSVLMRLGKVVVAVSDAERRLLLSRGYPARSLVTVLNGAVGSPREAIETSGSIRFAQPCVATLSGLHTRKAVGDVILAFAEVLPEFPEWHLNIIGDGPDRERLAQMIMGRGLENAVHLVGSTLTPRPLLEQTSIFASASLSEPFGLSVAEARASGCAVVATAVGGIPEVLGYGQAGHLVPASDPPAMAAVLRALMKDRETLATWRARAAEGAEFFTVERMASDYMGVYESVIEHSDHFRVPGQR